MVFIGEWGEKMRRKEAGKRGARRKTLYSRICGQKVFMIPFEVLIEQGKLNFSRPS